MLTPQEITEKGFVKAVFGGYDMTGVDDFLEELAADYAALYKENAILKGKLKVLVEKVEEYRSTEDAMRMALLTAQRMGEEITIEANKRKDETLQNAEQVARDRLTETARLIADEELRLSVAAKETSKFIELSQAIMRKHSEFLTKLEAARRMVRPDPEPPPPPPPTFVEQMADAAEQIGQAVERITSDGGNTRGGGGSRRSRRGGDGTRNAEDSRDAAHIPEYEEGPDAAPIPLYGEPGGARHIADDEDDSSARTRFDFDDMQFSSDNDKK